MPIAPEITIQAIEAYREKEGIARKWKEKSVPLIGWDACKLFVNVIFQQRHDSDRAKVAAQEFVDRRIEYCQQIFRREDFGNI